MKKYLFAAIIILTIGLMLSLAVLRKEHEERKRYQNNVEVLMTENEAWQTKGGRWAMTVEALELTNKELETYRAKQTALIKSQGVKIKRLESLSTAVALTEVNATAKVTEDSVVLPDSTVELIKSFHWADDHVSINGAIAGDMVDCNIQSTDTLMQYVYREPYKFLCIKWGTKSIRQTISSSNPHTKIVYNEHIKLHRK